MAIQSATLITNMATNSVANSTAVNLAAAAQLQPGPAFPNVGKGNAVLFYQIIPGATPGTYSMNIAESATEGGTYTDISNSTITQATVGELLFRNVTVTQDFVRVEITAATANAGTLSAILVSA